MIVDIERIKATGIDPIDYNSVIFTIQTDKEIILDNSYEITFILHSLIKGGALKLIIDMQNLAAIDSTGIGIFINHTKIIRTKGGDIVFCNVSSDIFEVFKIINLQGFIQIYNSENKAAINFKQL